MIESLLEQLEQLKKPPSSSVKPIPHTCTSPTSLMNSKDTLEQLQQLEEILQLDITCAACFNSLLSPTLCHPCGHTFCKSCIEAKERCPGCDALVSASTRNMLAENFISRFVDGGGIYLSAIRSTIAKLLVS